MRTQKLLNTRLLATVLTHYSPEHFFWPATVIQSPATTDLKGYLTTSILSEQKKVVGHVKG